MIQKATWVYPYFFYRPEYVLKGTGAYGFKPNLPPYCYKTGLLSCDPPCSSGEECCWETGGINLSCVKKGTCNSQPDCEPCKLDKPYVSSAYKDDCIADSEDTMSNLFGYGEPCQLKGCDLNQGAL